MSKNISVPIFDGARDYDDEENFTALREFAKKLRTNTYPTPDAAAEATHITRQTITRYEQAKARGSIKPRASYLAVLCEALYFKKLNEPITEPETFQSLLLEQINKAIEVCYRGEDKLKTWDDLVTLARSSATNKSKQVLDSTSSPQNLTFVSETNSLSELVSSPQTLQTINIPGNAYPNQPSSPKRRRRSSIILIVLVVNFIFIITAIAVLTTAALFSEVPYGPTKGSLEVIDGLTLSKTAVTQGEEIEFSFSIKNVGNQAVKIQDLGLGGRLGGKDWNEGISVNLPGITNITLQPENVYKFKGSRAFYSSGDYFAETVVRVGGMWGGITPYPRVYFKVTNNS